MSVTLVILIVVVLVVVWLVFAYNKFVRLTKQSEEAWSDISVQTKRRHDLIPNLVNTVKGYATHEQGTLDKVIQARNSAMSATTPDSLGKAENVLTGALKSVFALAEAYPDLKANTNFLQLQKEQPVRQIGCIRLQHRDQVIGHGASSVSVVVWPL